MTDFAYQEHLIKGDADLAQSWIHSSSLPDEEKSHLSRFVTSFSKLTFVKEDAPILDHYTETDGISLPPWLREVRSTLAFVDPPMLARVDDFQWYDSPRSDDVEEIWYNLRFGYHGEEQRQLFSDDAGIYRIGESSDGDGLYLGVDLQDHEDRRIFDFFGGDLRDNKLAGRPVRGSLYPIFESYAALLGHITEMRPIPY